MPAFFVLEILPAFFVVEVVDLVLELELEHGLEEPGPLEDGLEVAVDLVLEDHRATITFHYHSPWSPSVSPLGDTLMSPGPDGPEGKETVINTQYRNAKPADLEVGTRVFCFYVGDPTTPTADSLGTVVELRPDGWHAVRVDTGRLYSFNHERLAVALEDGLEDATRYNSPAYLGR